MKKSLEDWENSGINSLQNFLKIGDLVTEEFVDYFMNILPPAYMGYGILQVGEPYSFEYDPDSEKYRNTYTTFTRGEDGWMYCGECFYRQDKNRRKR